MGMPTHGRDPIAIVGIGCRLPGGADDPAGYWKLMADGVDAIREIPRDRWSIEKFYDPVQGTPGKTYSRWGGFLDGIDGFEPECFGISPREAAFIDPQHRLLLEVVWGALEDGGRPVPSLSGTRTGVFIGISTSDYANIQATLSESENIGPHSATGGAFSIAANRISYTLNLRGPSVAVDTACSSSLVAAHLACQSLWNGECDEALTGGVNAIISPGYFIGFCAASMLSADGRCKAFDASADGFVRGEGAAMMLLKPLAKALADGDPIYAVIVGSGVNQDGRTTGIAAPSQDAQEDLIRRICSEAEVDPRDVDYVEAHGTGTAVGDPIEARAIGRALSKDRTEDRPLYIGSVKTNIGHLEAGAGAAGAVKVALALKHRTIPPTLHFRTPNPDIPFEEMRLRIPQSAVPWPEKDGPALAGVNSFGFGGTNAHLLLKEHRSETRPSRGKPARSFGTRGKDPLRILVLSARSAEALQEMVRSTIGFLESNRELDLDDLCYTAALRRTHYKQRLSVVFEDRADLMERLGVFLAKESRPGLFSGETTSHPPKLAFVFSGQGPQWWGMGREFMASEPVFRRVIERCDEVMKPLGGWSLLEELGRDEDSSRLRETSIGQPAIFALQAGLAELWKSRGIEPDGVIGHSVGEVAAAYVAGSLTLDDAARVILHRGRCMDLASSRGRMLAVGLAKDDAAREIGPYGGRVDLAAVNGPESATLSGDPSALAAIAEDLERRGIYNRYLKVEYAFHSAQMDPVRDELLESLGRLEVAAPSRLAVSTVTGDVVTGPLFGADYWWRNVRECVVFADGVGRLIDEGVRLFVEVAPHPVLSGYVTQCLRRRETIGHALPTLRRGDGEAATMLGSMGALHCLGRPVDWKRRHPEGGVVLELPGHPWRREAYWHESRMIQEERLGSSGAPLLGRKIKSADPSWEISLDTRRFRFLKDHRLLDHLVFPATGFTEQALEAARDFFPSAGETTLTLEEVQFQRALVLPEAGPSTVQVTIYPSDGSFAIQSNATGSDQAWTLHVSGTMSDEPPAAVAEPLDLGEVNDGGYQEIDPALLHARFDEVGLHFGPTFRGIRKLWRKGRQVVGFAELPEGLEGTDEGYCFHPAFFDACWQAVAAAVSEEEFRNRPGVYIPVSIRRLRFHRTPGRQVWIRGELKTLTDRIFEADATFYDETGRPFLEIEGVRCQAIEARRGDRGEVRDWLFDVEWVHKPRPEATAGGRPEADFLPSCRDLRPLLETRAHDGARKLGWGRRLNEATRRYDSLAADYVLEALRELGCPPEPGTVLEPDDLIARYDLLPRFQRPLKRLLSLLEVCGYASRKGPGSWRLEAAAAASDASAACRDLFARFPGAYSEISLIARCGRAIAAVLKGRTDPLELLFPEGISGGTECFYQDAPGSGIPNTAARAALEEIASRLPSDRTLRVLEIGGGTGGLTAHVLPVLPADRTEYVFTDISAPFLQMAERKFSGRDFVTYRPFDLEKDPLSQGLEAGGFDVVLAANVLHATKDLRRSLAHIRSLLAPRGMVLLVEVDPSQRWTDAVFGLTEGWWRFEDTDLRSESPLLDAPRWRSLLETVGFREVEGVDVSPKGATSTQIVVLARGPEASGKTDEPAGGNGSRPEEEDPAVEEREPGAWVLFADRSGVAEEIARLLEARGQTCVLVKPSDAFRRSGPALFDVSPDAPDDMARLLESLPPSPEVRGFVHLWSLDADESVPSRFLLAERLGCHAVMHLVQAMEKIGRTGGSTKLLLVTRGAQPVGRFGEGIHQSPLLGLGRTIFNEAPWIDIRSVDLDPDPSRRDAVAIHEELWSADREEEIALRGVERFAPRLRPAPAVRVPVGLDAPDRADFEVVAAGAGVLDQIFLRRFRADPPGPGMVQIEVQAAALNFRDVMKGLNLYPTENDADRFLGDECAGRIIAVGDAVEGLAVGDEVVAMTPASFRSRVNAHAAFVIPKPSNRTFEEAVTIPVAFLTAAYGLHHLGRIAEGEKVLIHSGAGGVGLAAVQLAKAAGAEVFATAGNAEKRELLELLGVDHVLDSRSLEFADRVMEITRGRGVDIVLNSLAGKALAKSLSCLAPSGRFLELGKIDIYQNSRLGLRAFRKNISFFAIDLSRLVLEKPGLIRGMLLDLARRFEEDGLAPLPHRVFGVSRAAEAFRTMAKARHVGKVVLSFGERGLTAEAESAGPPAFRKDGTYLITGGLGGFGRSLASWIVENGGGHLMLVGRSGAEGEGAQEAVTSLRAAGARVETAAADVSRADDVARVLSFVRSSMPPLRGVFHAAMVLSDGVIMQLDARRFRKVTAPKVEGAWNLHEQTAGIDLDHFVLFSSVSAIIGNQGQANYAAANVFLDALAHTRRAAGLPGLSVNLGRLSGVGYLAGQEDLEELLDRKGVLGLTAPQALKALGHLLRTGPAQMGVLRMDWPLWVRSLASPRLPQRLAAIIDDDFGSPAGDDRTQAREAIFAAPPEERPGMARLYVVEQVAKVLGASAKQLDADRPLNELGFDSLMAVELKNKVETDLSINIPARELLDVPTIDRLVVVVLSQLGLAATAPADGRPSPEAPAGLVVALRRAGGAVPPLVLFHPTGGDLGMYKSLVSCLPQDVAVFGIRSRRIAGLGANAGSIDAMAGEYIKALLSGIPSGPRYLLGFSFGGLVAMTAAAMLEEMGEPVAGVGLVDASPQWADPTFPKDLVLKKRLAELYGFLRKELGSAEPGDGDGALAEFDAPVDEILSAGAEDRVQLISRWISLRGYLPGRVPKDAMEDYVARFESDMSLIETFQPRAIRAPISVWWPRDRRSHIKEPVGGWTPYSPEVTEAFIEGDHYTMMSPPGVHALADQLRRVLMGSESVPAT